MLKREWKNFLSTLQNSISPNNCSNYAFLIFSGEILTSPEFLQIWNKFQTKNFKLKLLKKKLR
jgi:hypothetical protein